MKKCFRIIASILIVSLLVVPCVFAETTTYTEAQVLTGTAFSTKLDFTTMTTADLTSYGSVAYSGTGVSCDTNGLTVSEDNTGNNYRFQPNVFDTSLGDAGALKVTFKLTGEGTMEMDIQNSSASQRIRFFTNGGKIGYNGKADTDSGVVTGTVGDTLETGVWHTYIIKKNAGKIAYYKLNNGGTYDKIIEYVPNTTSNNRFYVGVAGAGNSGSVTYKEITQYGDAPDVTTYTEAQVLDGAVENKKLDFTTLTTAELTSHGSIAFDGTGVSCDTNGMTVTEDATGNNYRFQPSGFDTSLGTDGALKVTFKLTGEGTMEMDIQNSTANQRIRFFTNGGKIGYNGKADTDASVVTGSAGNTLETGVWHTYIIKKNSGKIAYYKLNYSGEYEKIIEYVPNTTSNNRFYVGVAGGGNSGSVTYKEIVQYGEEVAVTDTEANILNGKLSQSAVLMNNKNISVGSYHEEKGINIPAGGAAKVRFKMTDAGLELVIGDGTTRVRMALDATTIYHADGSGTKSANVTHINNTWYTYIIQDAGTGYKYWRKADSDSEYSLVAEGTGKNSSTANYCRFTATGSTGNITVDSLYVFAPSSLNLDGLPVLEDRTAIATADKETVFKDGFDSQNDKWTLTNSSISGGTLSVNSNGGTDAASAILSSAEMDLSGAYQINFKFKLNKDYAEIIFAKDGLRVPCIFWENQMRIGANTAENIKTIPTRLDVWYDCILSFKADGKVDAYRKESECDYWNILYKNLSKDQGGSNNFEFHAGGTSQRAFEIDDLQVFKGISVDAQQYAVLGGSLTTGIDAEYGTPESTHNRRISVVAATYDKTYEYTSKVWKEDISVVATKGGHNDVSFDVSSVDLSNNDLSVMFVDSAATVYPLAKAQGYVPANYAGDISNDGQSVGINYQTDFNEVRVSGYAGKVCDVAVAILDGTDIKAIAQVPTGKFGMFDVKVAIDPTLPSGNYTLRVAYGSNAAEDYPIALYCDDNGHNSISSKGDFVTYLNSYASQAVKSAIADDTFATDVYNRFVEIKNGASFANLYLFRDAVNRALSDGTDERDFLNLVNAAAQNQKWDTLRSLITETYKDFLQTDLSLMSGVSDKKAMFMRMTGQTYVTLEAVKAAYAAAALAQSQVDQSVSTDNSFSGGGGGGGGGGFTIKEDKKSVDETQEEKTEIITPNNPGYELKKDFSDIADVDWATDSINDLHRRGFISGDENGNFNPNNNITREEFLKILMSASEITADNGGNIEFGDVDKNEWYFKFVNAAYKNGIIKGISDTEFGIGENITRADMAVMIKRVLDCCSIDAKATEKAFVFDDFDKIPNYARDSIFYLCEAGLMKGVGGNLFAPGSTATRAEAAVAIHRIYQYINERR